MDFSLSIRIDQGSYESFYPLMMKNTSEFWFRCNGNSKNQLVTRRDFCDKLMKQLIIGLFIRGRRNMESGEKPGESVTVKLNPVMDCR